MYAHKALLAFAVLILLALLLLGCEGFFVPINNTVSFPVFVANSGANNVSAYTIDPNTGALKQATGSPFGTNTSPVNPNALGPDKNGVFLYSANLGGGISGWTIASDGTLTAMNGSPFSAGNNYSSIAVDPNLRFVVAGSSTGATLQAFTVTLSTGALTASGGTVGTTGTPLRMVEDPTGRYIYVAEGASGVDAFTVTSGGALSLLQNTPLAAANDVAVDPSGKFVYVADGATGVNAYSITGTGGLQSVGPAVAAGTTPSGVAVSPSGAFVFVTNSGSNDVDAYTLAASTGALTPVTGNPFPASTQPVSIAVDPSARYVYVANKGANSVSIFTIDTGTGKLNSAGTTGAGTSPTFVLVAQ